MAVFDHRDKTEAWDGGSSKLAIWLDATAVAAIYPDATPTEGWYIPSYQVQTEVGPDRDSEEVKDEADNLIKTRTNRDEFIIQTTFFQATPEVIALIEHFEVAGNATLIRYPMPTDNDDRSMWVLGHSVTVRKENWRLQAANQQDRTIQVTFVLSKDADGNIKDIVELPNDTTDTEWDSYDEFRDNPTS